MSSISENESVWIIDKQNSVKLNIEKVEANEVFEKINFKVKYPIKQMSQLKSPVFLLKELNNSSWYLTIDPKVKEMNTGFDFISIYLHLNERSHMNAKFGGEIAKFDISFVSTKNDKTITKVSEQLYFCGLFGWGWKHFIKRNYLLDKSNKVDSNTIEINLLLRINLIELKESEETNESEPEESFDKQKKDLRFYFNHDFMNDKEYCDIKFIVDDVDFRVHSKLLASKSSIFKSMFAKNNRSSNEIFITDFDYEVFYELITFIYKGYAPNIERHCEKLLIAADYYKVSPLKSLCDNICFRKLTPEIAVDALDFGLKHNSLSVKVRAISYIAINLNQVIKSSQVKWKRFELQNKDLVKQIIAIRRMKCECSQHQLIN